MVGAANFQYGCRERKQSLARRNNSACFQIYTYGPCCFSLLPNSGWCRLRSTFVVGTQHRAAWRSALSNQFPTFLEDDRVRQRPRHVLHKRPNLRSRLQPIRQSILQVKIRSNTLQAMLASVLQFSEGQLLRDATVQAKR